MEKLKDYITNIANIVDNNTKQNGDVDLTITDVIAVNHLLEEAKKEITELEKVNNYNEVAKGFSESKDKKILGKTSHSDASKLVKDLVNHPSHYQGNKLECIDVMLDTFGEDGVLYFCKLNAFKYLYRANKKNGIEDMKKAMWYINKYIEFISVQ
jgi:hypothetical protein